MAAALWNLCHRSFLLNGGDIRNIRTCPTCPLFSSLQDGRAGNNVLRLILDQGLSGTTPHYVRMTLAKPKAQCETCELLLGISDSFRTAPGQGSLGSWYATSKGQFFDKVAALVFKN